MTDLGQSGASGQPTVMWEIRTGDATDVLRELPDELARCCITSPPYYGLRDYGDPRQIGAEATSGEYIVRLLNVFHEVRRVLSRDGTLWLNLGDSYEDGKQLRGIPWAVANALKQAGWILRSDIIWNKPNPMPESARDRPTNAHEHLFLLAKSACYYYDADAIREESASSAIARLGLVRTPSAKQEAHIATGHWNGAPMGSYGVGRNRRDVWEIAVVPYPDVHFATFPPKLVEPCVLAGSPEGGVVLDPFAGSGTTGLVALRHARSFIGIELSPAYVEMARWRIRDDAPLLNTFAEAVA